MKQEVQVTLTLEVDTEVSKQGIKTYFLQMEMSHIQVSSQKNRMAFGNISIIDIKEEAEMYCNDKPDIAVIGSVQGYPTPVSEVDQNTHMVIFDSTPFHESAQAVEEFRISTDHLSEELKAINHTPKRRKRKGKGRHKQYQNYKK